MAPVREHVHYPQTTAVLERRHGLALQILDNANGQRRKLAADLTGSVESPQAYRLATLPRSISWDEVRRMLEVVDRRTAASNAPVQALFAHEARMGEMGPCRSGPTAVHPLRWRRLRRTCL